MGGTEIYRPLKDIFNEPVDEKLPRHIYLLTDGAVSDTSKVVELIRNNNRNSRVHTFGIGSGVSTELIKDSALAGMGHYAFISELNEIEKKVLEALQKDFIDYLNIQKMEFFNKDGSLIYEKQNVDNVCYNQIFRQFSINSNTQGHPASVKIHLFDPNTSKDKIYEIQV